MRHIDSCATLALKVRALSTAQRNQKSLITSLHELRIQDAHSLQAPTLPSFFSLSPLSPLFPASQPPSTLLWYTAHPPGGGRGGGFVQSPVSVILSYCSLAGGPPGAPLLPLHRLVITWPPKRMLLSPTHLWGRGGREGRRERERGGGVILVARTKTVFTYVQAASHVARQLDTIQALDTHATSAQVLTLAQHKIDLWQSSPCACTWPPTDVAPSKRHDKDNEQHTRPHQNSLQATKSQGKRNAPAISPQRKRRFTERPKEPAP